MRIASAPEVVETRPRSLRELYERHSPHAYRWAYLLTGDRALAEDLVQDAFVKVAGRLTHLRKPDSFHAYLRQTVVNLSKMHFRRRRLELSYLEGEARRAEAWGSSDDPELRQDLWHELQRLPHRQRAAIVLSYYEDLTDRQAAEILRCRPATVRSLVFRGLRRLRDVMGSD